MSHFSFPEISEFEKSLSMVIILSLIVLIFILANLVSKISSGGNKSSEQIDGQQTKPLADNFFLQICSGCFIGVNFLITGFCLGFASAFGFGAVALFLILSPIVFFGVLSLLITTRTPK